MINQEHKELESAVKRQDIQGALSSLTGPPYSASTINQIIDLLKI